MSQYLSVNCYPYPQDNWILSIRYAYFSDRTGPDFMHPIYTLGFNACFDKICPSVAANAKLRH